jgi:O-succinylbenzoic acid--CoA ligase
VFHAVQRLRAVLVPLNTRLAPAEVAALLADCEPRVVLYDPDLEPLLRGAPSGPVRLSVGELGGIDPRTLPSPAAIDPASPLTILYTSGTTGRPKGAVLSNAAHAASARASRQRLGREPGDHWLALLPLFHVGGLAILVRAVFDGVPVTLHSRFEPQAACRAVRDEGVTLVSVVATMLGRMLDAGLVGGRLRWALVGGGPVPAPLIERAARVGVPAAPTYGLTEAASQVATSFPEEARAFPGTCGRPLPGTEIRIADPDREGIGELLVRGPTLMSGYFRRPEETARALRDRWLHTGDFGRLDSEGRLFVHARRSDLIVSGGENVYPAEVETVLRSHAAVAEAAVFAEADPEWGQRVVAAVRLRPGARATEEELRGWCSERLARFKVPRSIRFAAEPVSSLGRGTDSRRAGKTWKEE